MAKRKPDAEAELDEDVPPLVDDPELTAVAREFTDACILRAVVATTGYRGGDSGHGGRTEIVFENVAGVDMEASHVAPDGSRISLLFGGDAELRVAIRAFRFVADSLEKLAGQ
jgi:hypothetical protein